MAVQTNWYFCPVCKAFNPSLLVPAAATTAAEAFGERLTFVNLPQLVDPSGSREAKSSEYEYMWYPGSRAPDLGAWK